MAINPEISPDDDLLQTWPEIAGYLKMSVSTAQQREREEGLPVRRLGTGRRSQVIANKSDLDHWRSTRYVSSPELESIRSTGTPTGLAVSADAEKVKLPEAAAELSPAPEAEAQPKAQHKPALPRRLTVSVAIGMSLTALAVIIGLLTAGYRRYFSNSVVPSQLVVQGDTLIAKGQVGEEVWRRYFPKGFDPNWEGHPLPQNQIWANGRFKSGAGPETLLLYHPTAVAAEGTQVVALAPSGALRWEYAPTRSVSYGRGPLDPPYFFNHVITMFVDGVEQALVSANHHYHAPNVVARLDGFGRLQQEYWHSGHLYVLATADLQGDGRKELLAGGLNNGLAQATLVVLDPRHMNGVNSVHGEEPPLQVPGLPVLHEEYVLLFPRTCFIQPGQHNVVTEIRVSPSRIVVIVNESVSVAQSPGGVIYEFDYHFNLLNVTATERLVTTHLEREAAGSLHHRFIPDELQRLRADMRVIRSSKE